MKNNKTDSLYRAYLDGQAMYSVGTVAPAVETADGWEVQPAHLANTHERMIGAATMRHAVIGMLEAGGTLNDEVARDLAHWLLALNDGRAVGLFVPLALAADGVSAVIDAATDENIQARHELADALSQSGTVQDLYRAALIDSLNRADRGRLAGLAAPRTERIAASLEVPENDEPPVLQPQVVATPIQHKLRTNSLDALINKAITQANCLITANVFVKLKEIALNSEPPFTGAIEGSALCYTNDQDMPAVLTKNALDKRLRLRREASRSVEKRREASRSVEKRREARVVVPHRR